MKRRITAILALVGIVLSLQLPAMALTCATADCSHLAAIGDTCYDSIQAAVDAAPATGDTLITILRDDHIDFDAAYAADAHDIEDMLAVVAVEGKTVIIDINGKNLTCIMNNDDGSIDLFAYFAAGTDGHITLKDSSGNNSGKVEVTANGYSVYSLLACYPERCSILVEGGTYTLDKASNALLYSQVNADSSAVPASGMNIADGVFTLGNVGEKGPGDGKNYSPWIVNIKGSNERHAGISGGTFNFNVLRHYWTKEVQQMGSIGDWRDIAVIDNKDGTWTVTDEPVALTEEYVTSDRGIVGEIGNSFSRDIGFATLKEAIAASHNGEVTMLADCDVDGTLEIDKDITIDPASYTINWTGNDTDPIFTVKAGKTLDMVGAGFFEPKRAGYNFHGWYTDENCTAGNEFTGVSYGDANTTADISLWAKWEEKEDVSITSLPQSYNYDGGAKAFSVIGSPDSGYKVEYKVGGSWTETAPSASGIYDVRVSRPEDGTYKAFSLEIARGLVINGAAAPEPEPTPSAPARENPNTGVHK